MPSGPTHPPPFAVTAAPAAVDPGAGDRGAGDTVVLAPNSRAAQDLRARFAAARLAAGDHAWTPPPILTFGTWTASLWSGLLAEGLELRTVLNPGQEHLLWTEVISAAGTRADVLQGLYPLAEMAAGAYRLAAEHNALRNLRRSANTYDSRIFAEWARQFEARCDAAGFVPSAVSPLLLTERIIHGDLPGLPSRVELAGWRLDEASPARRELLHALRRRGCDIVGNKPAAAPGALRSVVRAATPAAEIDTALTWIRSFLRERIADGNPAPHIALVVPGLADERSALEARLRAVLAPELDDIAADISSAPWDFASGQPLGATAVAATALEWLHWLAGPLPIDRASALLLSPFLGSSESWAERAELDAFGLRAAARLRPEFSADAAANLARQAAPATATRLRALARRSAEAAAPRSFALWTDFIRDTLAEAGWPGSRELSAAEFAATRSWEHALDSVATLDFTGTSVGFPAALRALQRAVEAASVRLETGAAIHVMAPEDVPGTAWEALVFLHATDAAWPPAERTHPFLSWSLQRERGMPGTDPAAAFARAQAATAAMAAGTAEVLFLYPADDNAGKQRLSPFVASLGLPEIDADALNAATPAESAVPLDRVEDLAPLPPLPQGVTHGGSRLLQMQAACAFRALAEFRLHSVELERQVLGLDPRQSGIFLHNTMERFWRHFRDQASVRSASAAELDAALAAAMADALPRSVAAESSWDAAYLALQKERLARLLRHWVRLELARAPFSVLEQEQTAVVELGPLRLSVRRDRMDQTEGGVVLVDYKTGSRSHPKDWVGPRPDDPQLPLYALVPPAETVRGIVFAKIRPGKDMKWLGYADAPGILDASATHDAVTLAEQIEDWRATLLSLAEDFASGRAAVSPKAFPGTCTYCGQRLLCRVDPRFLQPTHDPAEEDAEVRGAR